MLQKAEKRATPSKELLICSVVPELTQSIMFSVKAVAVIAAILLHEIPQVQPYEITLDSFAPTKSIGQPLVNYGTLRLSKKGRNNYDLSGNFTMLRNLGRQFRATFEFGRISGDSFLPPVKMEQEFCQLYDSDTHMLEAFRNVSNFPPKGTCPLLKGPYYIDGYGVNERHFPPATLPGAYLMKFVIAENGKNVAGFSLHATLTS
ncbi:uncharacterized protein LOC131681108 [Topomyia yanbarensis]|uniref:uncharacterized protein LOC131681108 n=1 Tax=Topomyia yanbarensis TaxID=2498891 RepID=UPI00273C0B45|nr:uncharacterized protein LOC131681108 [Topomyia yanbarensis]